MHAAPPNLVPARHRRWRVALAGAVLSLAAGHAGAQRDAWQLPPRGAAEYRRVTGRLVVAPPAVDARAGIRHVIRPAAAGGHRWRHRSGDRREDGFAAPAFDDSGWTGSRGDFGDRARFDTRWPADRRFLEVRGRFALGRRTARGAVLRITHDDLATVWINGVEVYRGDRYRAGHSLALDAKALDALTPGENLLAVRVENTGGAAAFDLGLTICDRSFRGSRQAVDLIRARAGDAAALRRGLAPGFRAPPALCQGQLDPRQQTIRVPPIDLRDVGPFLALDLDGGERSHSRSGRLPRMFQFGDLGYRGHAASVADDGIQRIEVDLKAGEPRADGDDPDFVERHLLRRFAHELEATLTIERRVDAERGVVDWFRYELDGTLTPRSGRLAGRPFALRFDEEWRLDRVRDNRDADFRRAVVDAIRRGAARLKREIADPKRRVLRNQPRGNRSYNSGRLALALLALLHAEVPHDDPVVVRALDALRRRRFVDTYSTAHAIMALEKYYTPRGEIEELRSGRIDRPRQRRPSDADRELLRRWTDILLRNVDTRVDPAELLRFNYTRGARFDHSVNQYGLLGLYSAHLCGIEIAPRVWIAAANHLVDGQARPQGRLAIELTDHAELDDLREGRTSTGARPALVAGWGYTTPESGGVRNPAYGAMTCAGIAGLTICQAGLRDAELSRHPVVGDADRAIRNGFAWLAAHFGVHANVGRYAQPFYWVYYYLYGLERACELGGVALIDGRDWYFEGALTLLANQQADGSWPDDLHPDEVMERTAMAVLFLKKASMPVYTRR